MIKVLISIACTLLVFLSTHVVASAQQPPRYNPYGAPGANPFGPPTAIGLPVAAESGAATEETKAVEAGDEPEDPEAKKKNEEEKKKAERQQKLKKLTFDRRPSTILKEWAKSTEDPEPESED